MVEFLIKNGATVNIKDKYQQTPLHKAAENGHAETAKVLIENGHEIDTTNNFGRSPMQEAAASYLDTSIVFRLLVERGANIDHKDDKGKSRTTVWDQYMENMNLWISISNFDLLIMLRFVLHLFFNLSFQG